MLRYTSRSLWIKNHVANLGEKKTGVRNRLSLADEVKLVANIIFDSQYLNLVSTTVDYKVTQGQTPTLYS